MHDRSRAFGLTRRHVLAAGAAGTAAILAARAKAAERARAEIASALAEPTIVAAGPFTLPPLPYKEDALAPISANTLSFHHGKHHAAYVDKLNKAVEGNKKYEGMDLVQVVQASAKEPVDAPVFNNAAQAWNHAFYWSSMKPGGGGEPSGKLADRIKADFGDVAGFKKQFGDAANGVFGSGWTWLTVENGKLAIVKTSNADTPIARGGKPLLVLDVWEHAYYLDFQNKRADYVAAFLDKLLNWEFAAQNLG